jgi:predicted negative regulator of RcsB-dependent stress response
LARVLAKQGRRDEASDSLRSVAADFEQLGMTLKTAEVGLEILETLVTEEEWADAVVLAQSITSLFTRQGSQVDAAAAYAQLRNAIAATSATPDFVREIRSKIMDVLAEESARTSERSDSH